MSVLVNEFGDEGYDGRRLRTNNRYNVTELANGCICCSLKPQLMSSIKKMYNDYQTDILLIEPTGLATSDQILDVVNRPSIKEFSSLSALLVVIDGSNFTNIYRAYRKFFENQIKSADIILINKADLIKKIEQKVLVSAVKEYNQSAIIEVIEHGNPPSRISKMLNDNNVIKNRESSFSEKSKIDKNSQENHHLHDHYFEQVKSISIKIPQNLSFQEITKKLLERIKNEDILRIKGIIKDSKSIYGIDWNIGQQYINKTKINPQEQADITESSLTIIGNKINKDWYF